MRNFLLGILFVVIIGGIVFAAYQYGKTGGVKISGVPATTPVTTQEVTSPIVTVTLTPPTGAYSSLPVSPTIDAQSTRI